MVKDEFDHFGFSVNRLPPCKNTYKGTCIVVGGGWNVWEDLSKIDWSQHDILCINDIYMHFPGDVTHFYSNNHTEMPNWIKARVDRFRKTYTKTTLFHTNRIGDYILWPWPGHGTSGLNGVFTALGLGYDQVILAGIPLDDGGHYYDPRPSETTGSWCNRKFSNFVSEIPTKQNRIKYWEDAKEKIFRGRVKSLSGRTKELLND